MDIKSIHLFIEVREHIPLEQGLRQLIVSQYDFLTVNVREHIPLEQGLRHRSYLTYRQ